MPATGLGQPPLTAVHQLGSPALTIAELIEHTHANILKWTHEEGLWPAVLGLTNGHRSFPIPSHRQYDRETLTGTFLVLAIQHLWRKGSRVVYAMDPDLVLSLAGAGDSDIPGELFRNLPHTTPLVVFPEPLLLKIGSTQQDGLVYGFYVHGVTGGPADRNRKYCATDDPDATHLGFAFVTAVLDEAGERVIDYDVTRCSVPLVERFSMTDAIADVMRVFQLDTTSTQAALDRGVTSEEVFDGSISWLRSLLTIGFNTLLYLCSDDADVQATPKPKAERMTGKGKKSGQRKEKPPRLLKVGWRMGAALRLNRKLVDEEIAVVHASTGRRLKPQQRAGHFRWTRHGKGRALKRLTYIKPYWISLDLLEDGAEPEARIVPVVPKG